MTVFDSSSRSTAFSQVYVEQLSARGHGLPLWQPEPIFGDEINLGDIGYLRDNGFARLYNATLPPDDPSHARLGVPRDFTEPLVIRDDLIVRSDHWFARAQVLKTTAVRKVPLDFGASPDVLTVDENTRYVCPNDPGALLYMKQGATRRNLHHKGSLFRDYILEHYQSWLAFANDTHKLNLREDQLVFVTGCDKGPIWQVAAFMEEEHGAMSVESRSGPNDPDPLRIDQCLFIRGYKVKEQLLPALAPVFDDEPDDELPYHPVNAILDYILTHSDATIAIAHDDDLAALGVHDYTREGIQANLNMLSPSIMINGEVGMIRPPENVNELILQADTLETSQTSIHPRPTPIEIPTAKDGGNASRPRNTLNFSPSSNDVGDDERITLVPAAVISSLGDVKRPDPTSAATSGKSSKRTPRRAVSELPAEPTKPTTLGKAFKVLALTADDHDLERLITLAEKLQTLFPVETVPLAEVLDIVRNASDEDGTVNPDLHGAAQGLHDPPVHVFIDYSNISIGFLDSVQGKANVPNDNVDRGADAGGGASKKRMSHEALFLVLERGRPITRRVLAGSGWLAQILDKAEKMGYEVHVLARVVDTGEGADRIARRSSKEGHKRRRSSASSGKGAGRGGRPLFPSRNSTPMESYTPLDSPSGWDGRDLASPNMNTTSPVPLGRMGKYQGQQATSLPVSPAQRPPSLQPQSLPSDSELDAAMGSRPAAVKFVDTDTPPKKGAAGRVRYREQGVDEVLQMKILQAIVSASGPNALVPEPGTIILATGDGSVGQYNEEGFVGCVGSALRHGWRVELYAWEKGLSNRFKKEFGKMEGFKLVKLDAFASDLLETEVAV